MDLVFRIFIFLLLFLDKLLRPLFWVLSFREDIKIPPIDNCILFLSATQLAKKIRQKKLSSQYVVNIYIERIKAVNPIINAIVEDRFEASLRDAKHVDEYLAHTFMSEFQLERHKPFLGVPITIKESCGMEGLSQAVGLVKRIGYKCPKDCVSVKRLKDAGFVPLLVSTTPEFCIGLETNTLLNGLTRNPYNTNKTAGGSSGGEATLLGSGSSVVGLGTDFAGSIRVPCMFNGIFGHKTTPRIICRDGHFPESEDTASYDYFAIGPMVRYAEDLKPMLKVLCGKDGLNLNLDQAVNLSKLKVYRSTADYDIFGIQSVDADIRLGIEKSALYLKSKFASKIEDVRFNELQDAIEIGISLFLGLKDRPNLLEDPNNPKITKNLYLEVLKSCFRKSHLTIHTTSFNVIHRFNGCIPKSRYDFYRTMKERLQKQFVETLGGDGVFLYPTFPTAAFQHYQGFTKSQGLAYSMIFNLLECPSTQVPIGLNKDKMPIGIQVVAAPHQDRICIAVAEELEKLFGGWIPPYST